MIEAEQVPRATAVIDRRVVRVCVVALVLGCAGAVASFVLLSLIDFVTNVAFYQRLSFAAAAPAGAVAGCGAWVIAIPVVGALVVGVMARYGSMAIRGHGIPEAMEKVLTERSRIPARVMFLRPVASAISIGTGGPFGAEGPIIATGGALGSLVGQLLHITGSERKTLLAAGAAAGMAATFGSPVSATLLAVELLLFEYRPQSIIPVALAASSAAGLRVAFAGAGPVFAMDDLAPPSLAALASYIALGGALGLAAALVTRVVYGVEDAFAKLPIHWMWWPALGAVVVGLIGWLVPDTLGIGYYNITDLLGGTRPLAAVAFLCAMKLVSWSVSLGSGTSGGTMAPLFTIGGAMGAVIGGAASWLVPAAGIDVRAAALVGMATMFAGATRAMLASVVLAFETTHQSAALLPLLGGCAAAYLVSWFGMRNTIMTEKIARRGVRAPVEYTADPLEQVLVGGIASRPAVTLKAQDTVQRVRDWIASGAAGSSHQGFPVVDARGVLVGVLTRRDLFASGVQTARVEELITVLPRFVYDDCTVRQAAEHMVNHGIGRLPVVNRVGVPRVIGMITRSDVLSCYRRRIDEHLPERPSMRLRLRRGGRGSPAGE